MMLPSGTRPSAKRPPITDTKTTSNRCDGQPRSGVGMRVAGAAPVAMGRLRPPPPRFSNRLTQRASLHEAKLGWRGQHPLLQVQTAQPRVASDSHAASVRRRIEWCCSHLEKL
eukprot:3623791-Prymnesium_polylepis.1